MRLPEPGDLKPISGSFQPLPARQASMVMNAVLEIGGGVVVADANSARNPGAVPVNTIGPRIDLGELRRRRAARKAALENDRKGRRGAEPLPDTATPGRAAAEAEPAALPLTLQQAQAVQEA